MDPFVKDVIDEAIENNPSNQKIQGLKFELIRDRQLKHIEKKVRDTYGPLSSLLRLMEKKNVAKITNTELFDATDKVVVLLNQVRQSIVYQRQRSILSAMKKSDSKAKEIIK